MLKAYEIKQANVPRFEELSFKVFWEIVCSDPELKIYFPDYKDSVLPERKYLLDLLFTIKTDVVVDMIKEAQRIRKIDNEPDEDQIVEVKKDLLQEILETDFGSGKSLQV